MDAQQEAEITDLVEARIAGMLSSPAFREVIKEILRQVLRELVTKERV